MFGFQLLILILLFQFILVPCLFYSLCLKIEILKLVSKTIHSLILHSLREKDGTKKRFLLVHPYQPGSICLYHSPSSIISLLLQFSSSEKKNKGSFLGGLCPLLRTTVRLICFIKYIYLLLPALQFATDGTPVR